MSISNPRSIVLRQYPSFSQPSTTVSSPKEFAPNIIYTRSPPAQPINPTIATTIVREPRVVMAPPIAAQPRIIRIEKDNLSIESEYSDSSIDRRRHRKLLSGFHPYYDKEADIFALQCCTCCVGCCRKCSTRCTGCENFISCPIYCWLLFILPVFILLLAGLIITSIYAAHVF